MPKTGKIAVRPRMDFRAGSRVRNPKVSVVVPCYNVEAYVEECLDSLIGQTMRSMQIICVDDGSTDETAAIIERCRATDSRIELIRKPNSGYGDSMNIGFAAARGEYIGILEPDDFASRTMYKTLYRTAKRHDLDVVKAAYFDYAGGCDTLFDPYGLYEPYRVFDPADEPSIMVTTPCIWSALYRRRMVEEYGIRFTGTPGASFQDTGFVLKAWFAARRAMVLRRAFVHYRNDNPNSSVKSSAKIFEICGEFDTTDSFMRFHDANRRHAFAGQFTLERFNTYRWNYNRIAEECHVLFARRMRDDLARAAEAGDLRRACFPPESLVLLDELLADPDAFAAAHPEGF